jgi:hypothetical protein
MEQLSAWLNAHESCDVPGVKYLFDTFIRICADDKLDGDDVFQIQLAIERVLPKQYRDLISEKRKQVYYDGPASEAQLKLLNDCHVKVNPNISKREASTLITSYFENPPASNRQKMFLRFWDRVDVGSQGRRGVSDWMDSFIAEDYRRKLAWELFKSKTHDDGTQRDPSCVPIGIGFEYLKKVRL